MADHSPFLLLRREHGTRGLVRALVRATARADERATARLLGATIGLDARHPRLRTLSPGEVGRDDVAHWASAEMAWRTRSPSLHH